MLDGHSERKIMMYASKFVVDVKVGGKILRNHGDTVYLPFGSEYSIFFKNLNTVRALVNVEIDGKDVLGGSSLVVQPNDSLELERFLKDLNKGNRFKFIERTAAVEKHRGVDACDGLLRVTYKFEVPAKAWAYPRREYLGQQTPWNHDHTLYGPVYKSSSLIGNAAEPGRMLMGSALPQNSVASVNEVGITAPGSVSDQKFHTISVFDTESTEHVIILRLLGGEGDKKVVAPVTVKRKVQCTSCGKVNKGTAKFCSECGTGLEII